MKDNPVTKDTPMVVSRQMTQRTLTRATCALGLALLTALSVSPASGQTAITTEAMSSMYPRSIGPAVTGGRIHDVEALPNDPSTVFVGTSIRGAVEVHESGPDMGERLLRQAGEHLR